MDTFAPVARMTTGRFDFELAVMLTLHVSGIDFTNAFLNAPINYEIYVNPPPGFPPLPKETKKRIQSEQDVNENRNSDKVGVLDVPGMGYGLFA